MIKVPLKGCFIGCFVAGDLIALMKFMLVIPSRDTWLVFIVVDLLLTLTSLAK